MRRSGRVVGYDEDVEVVAMDDEFVPTHRVIVGAGWLEQREDVMCVPYGDGYLCYTRDAWQAGDLADWEVDAEGQWWFQGRVAPLGADQVRIERLTKDAEP